jgi:hypothetical protein
MISLAIGVFGNIDIAVIFRADEQRLDGAVSVNGSGDIAIVEFAENYFVHLDLQVRGRSPG